MLVVGFKGSGSSKCVFLKIIYDSLEYFLSNISAFPALFEVGAGENSSQKLSELGCFEIPSRFLECHFINGSF